MSGKHHSEQLKREVYALWKAGAGLSDIARDYGLPDTTVRGFIRQIQRLDAKNQHYEQAKKALPSGGVSFVAKEPSPQGSIVLAIPDLHCPFEHPDSLAFLLAVRDKYNPDTVICLGDEVDFHAFSRFPHDPDGFSVGHELSEAVKKLIPFYQAFPNVMVCESNHTVRGHKKAFESGLPASFLTHISRVLNAPDGWKWAHKWEVDGVIYIHGEGRSGFNAHVQFMRGYKQSVVIGHIHSFAAVSHEGGLFAVNSGCLIDSQAYCFRYAKNMPIPVNLGCSIIHHGKRAEFIPMQLEDGRWNGKL